MQDLLLTEADKGKLQQCIDEALKDREKLPDSERKKLSVQSAQEMGVMAFLKYKCLTDLFFLGYEILGLKNIKVKGKLLIYPPLHRQLAQAIEAPGSKMIIIPRFCLKTEWIIVRIVQRILQEPDTVRIAYMSRTSGLGRSVLKRVVQYMMNPALMELFQGTIPKPGKLTQGMPTTWDRVTEDYLTVHRDRTSGLAPKEHQLEIYGIEATITGKHFTDQIYDDPINEETVRSPTQMEKVVEFIRMCINLLEPGGNETYIGTPYHYADIIAHCINEGYFDKIYKRSLIEHGESIYPTFFPLKEIERRKKRMGNYMFSCNPAGSPVMMSDFSFKNIEDVNVGDEVVGFVHGDFDNRCLLSKSTVTAVGAREAEIVKVVLEDGETIYCTPDHKWYTGRVDESHSLYLEAGVGRRVCRAAKVTPRDHGMARQWGYLGGIIDGEGSCKHGGVIAITQSHLKNPDVVASIRTVLDDLDLNYGEYKSDYHGGTTQFHLNGGRQMKIDILANCDFAKRGQVIKEMWNHPKRPILSRPKVVSIEPAGKRIVYSFQTTTGNYVVWGLMSKNCQLMCDPLPKEDLLFPPPQPTYSTLPPDSYDYYITIDPAATVQTYSDYTAFAVTAVDSLGRVWVEDAFQVKKEGQEIARIILQMNEKYKPKGVGIEAGLQTHLIGIIQLTKKNWEVSQGKTIMLPIEPLVVSTKDKFDRINMTVGSWIRTGRLKIKENLTELMGQMEKINPNYQGHDDMIDALSLVFQLVPSFGYKMNQATMPDRVWNTFEELLKKSEKPVKWAERFAV